MVLYIWGFSACSKDGKPEGRTGKNWCIDLYDAIDLLEGKDTRSKSLKFIFSTKEVEDKIKLMTRKKACLA